MALISRVLLCVEAPTKKKTDKTIIFIIHSDIVSVPCLVNQYVYFHTVSLKPSLEEKSVEGKGTPSSISVQNEWFH